MASTKLLFKTYQGLAVRHTRVFRYKAVLVADMMHNAHYNYQFAGGKSFHEFCHNDLNYRVVFVPIIENVEDGMIMAEGQVLSKKLHGQTLAIQTNIIDYNGKGISMIETSPSQRSDFLSHNIDIRDEMMVKLDHELHSSHSSSSMVTDIAIKQKEFIWGKTQHLFSNMQVGDRPVGLFVPFNEALSEEYGIHDKDGRRIITGKYRPCLPLISNAGGYVYFMAMKMTSKSDVEKFSNTFAFEMTNDYFEGHDSPLTKSSYVIPSHIITSKTTLKHLQIAQKAWGDRNDVIITPHGKRKILGETLKALHTRIKDNLIPNVPSWNWLLDENDGGPSVEELISSAQSKRKAWKKLDELNDPSPHVFIETVLIDQLKNALKLKEKNPKKFEKDMEMIVRYANSAANLSPDDVYKELAKLLPPNEPPHPPHPPHVPSAHQAPHRVPVTAH